MRTVKELADLAGVTVRTLHHYDEIGLLRPSARSSSGYRLYSHDDLIRLQQILSWRALGMGLAEIGVALDDPDHDTSATLMELRADLAARRDDLTAMMKSVDAVLDELAGGDPAEEETMFDGFDEAAYAEEAEARWGETEAWRQSRERTARWTQEDKRRVAHDGLAFAKRLAAAYQTGADATSMAAMDLAEQGRLDIDRQFYDCSYEMHVNLGEMYVADPRFTAYYDQHAEGLAAWYRDAIVANAARHAE